MTSIKSINVILTLALVLAGCSAPKLGPGDEAGKLPDSQSGATATSEGPGDVGNGQPSGDNPPVTPGPDGGSNPPENVSAAPGPPRTIPGAPLVVATLDSGTNPFHPCWRENAPATPHQVLPYLPPAMPLPLQSKDTYEASLKANEALLSSVQDHTLYYIPGTRLLFYGLEHANEKLIDKSLHGGQASSQIACDRYAFGSDAFVLVLNYIDGESWTVQFPKTVAWVKDQPWVDIVHLNIQDQPQPQQFYADFSHLNALVDTGKFVIVAAGNGVAGLLVNYPMETSQYAGPPGTLIIGACDQDGWTVYSNMDPHVAADGEGTLAADPAGLGSVDFYGTSSASPRAAGYVSELLVSLRKALNITVGMQGTDLIRTTPLASGPLQDGILTAAELHEVVRKTADAKLGPSRLDGNTTLMYVPTVEDFPLNYAKVGYGKLTEDTLEHALQVLLGTAPLPTRQTEDEIYNASETWRSTYWGNPPL